jgi:hypothetical protein
MYRYLIHKINAQEMPRGLGGNNGARDFRFNSFIADDDRRGVTAVGFACVACRSARVEAACRDAVQQAFGLGGEAMRPKWRRTGGARAW